jgi:uncharacterized OB-fold protein
VDAVRAIESDGLIAGAQCLDCGRRMVPERMCCVSCFGRNLKPVSLGGQGVVECCTTVHQAPPGYDGPVPYVLAMVLLGNDVHVLSHLIGKPPHEWRRGDAVVPCRLHLPAIDCMAFRPA